MSSAHQLLQELRALGVEVVASGDRLLFRPASAVGPELRQRLKQEKQAMLNLLRQGAPPKPDGPWPTRTWGPLYVEHFVVRTPADLASLPAAPDGIPPSPEPRR